MQNVIYEAVTKELIIGFDDSVIENKYSHGFFYDRNDAWRAALEQLDKDIEEIKEMDIFGEDHIFRRKEMAPLGAYAKFYEKADNGEHIQVWVIDAMTIDHDIK